MEFPAKQQEHLSRYISSSNGVVCKTNQPFWIIPKKKRVKREGRIHPSNWKTLHPHHNTHTHLQVVWESSLESCQLVYREAWREHGWLVFRVQCPHVSRVFFCLTTLSDLFLYEIKKMATQRPEEIRLSETPSAHIQHMYGTPVNHHPSPYIPILTAKKKDGKKRNKTITLVRKANGSLNAIKEERRKIWKALHSNYPENWF